MGSVACWIDPRCALCTGPGGANLPLGTQCIGHYVRMVTETRDRRPPEALVRALKPLMRVFLGSRLGRLVGGLAVLEFGGRRTHRRYHVVTGWYRLEGDDVVFTPALWRSNFTGGAAASVRHRGTLRMLHGVLDTDPASVAEAFNRVISAGTSPRALGLRVPPGHRLTSDDVERTKRAVIRFTSTQS